MPEAGPQATGSSTDEEAVSLPSIQEHTQSQTKPRRRRRRTQMAKEEKKKEEGLTARQVVGAIAVAVLVAVI